MLHLALAVVDNEFFLIFPFSWDIAATRGVL